MVDGQTNSQAGAHGMRASLRELAIESIPN